MAVPVSYYHILLMRQYIDSLRLITNFWLLIDAVIGRDSSYLFLRGGISTSGNYQTQLKITIIMGKNYCALKDCHNTAGMRGRFGKVVKLHHLPTGNRTLRSAWVRAISRKNYRASSYTQVCSDHFPGGNGRTWQHNTPTLFLPQKDMEFENAIHS